LSSAPIDFVNLFVRPPGELLYFLFIIVISLAGMFMALGQRARRPNSRSAQRYFLASLGAVMAWLVLMAGALYTILSRQNPAIIIPPLERAASVNTILLIGWAFLTADHTRWGRAPNLLVLILMAIIVVGYMISGLQWPLIATQRDFNLSVFGITWTFVPAILCVLGFVVTIAYFRSVIDAPLKLLFFLLLSLGYGITLLQILQGAIIGNYAGLTRLAFAAALTIVPAVIHRAIVGQLQADAASPKLKTAEMPAVVPTMVPVQARQRLPDTPLPSSPIERESVQLLKALGIILSDATPLNIPQRIVDAALEIIKADVGALLRLQDANYADITSAYDRVMKRGIPALALSLDQQPTLVNSIERQAQRPLFPDRNVKELDDLFTRLDVNQRGPVYFQPLVNDKKIVAVLMISLPYSGRELREGEQELLKGFAVISASLLSLSYAANDARRRAEERVIQAMVEGVNPAEVKDDDVIAARREMEASLQAARDQIGQLTRQVMELKVELEYERSRVEQELEDSQEGLSISQQMVALADEQNKLREEREQLNQRLQDAAAALAGATGTDSDSIVNNMIESLQREKEDLLAQRANLQAQLDDLRANDKTLIPNMQQIVQHMVQEKNRLESERTELQGKIGDVEGQLQALGIEGESGVAQLINQLNEQRLSLQAKNDAFKRERDALLAERARLEESINQAREWDTRIDTLQTEIKNLAADREALIKQRDQLRLERDEFASNEEQGKSIRARLLSQSAGYEIELSEAHAEQAQLRAQLQKLDDERSSLISERDRLLAEKQAVEIDHQQLLARVEGDRGRLQQVGSEGVGSLTKMVEELSTQREGLERELHETRTKLAAVEKRLERIGIAAKALPKFQPEQPELMMGLVQELRTPMTSIGGYVDLLIGESAGILGEMQRKFIQRIRTNVTRLGAMIEDLVRLTALDTGKFSLSPESVNVVNLIEEAITNSSMQFREKSLTVHLDLDDTLPLLRIDRDAISQMIGELLTNAYLVSPPDSEIFVKANKQAVDLNGTATDCLVVSIEDRGGGISAEDETRVFSRKYRAENPLIQGLGDTGVGLSVARALAEAHGGKLWLGSRANLGAIFSFALPFEPALEPEG
jgi:signal transduction histidine kinase